MATITLHSESEMISAGIDPDVLKSLIDYAERQSKENGRSCSRQINDFFKRHRIELDSSPAKPVGYHVIKIPKGQFGDSSKIYEETMEAIDAEAQGNRIMTLIEMADIVGAIDGYLAKHYGGQITLEDVVQMSEANKRAFEAGVRSDKTSCD